MSTTLHPYFIPHTSSAPNPDGYFAAIEKVLNFFENLFGSGYAGLGIKEQKRLS
jgi:hypothetical protein